MTITNPQQVVDFLTNIPKEKELRVNLDHRIGLSGNHAIASSWSLNQLWDKYWNNPSEVFCPHARFNCVSIHTDNFSIAYSQSICEKYTFKDFMDDWSVYFNERMEGF